MSEVDPYFVPTKTSIAGSSTYTCVVHELSRSKLNVDKIISDSPTEQNKTPVNEADRSNFKREQNAEMKRLRFDVYKFARTGMKAKDKFTADKELAIRLGAERPKRSGKNYVDLKNEVTERRKAVAALKANPSVSVNVSLHDPYKTNFSLTKKMRIERKKGNIGGMLNDYGKVKYNCILIHFCVLL